jgi:hypothetical protein
MNNFNTWSENEMEVQQQKHDLKEKITTVTVDYLKALENEINQD